MVDLRFLVFDFVFGVAVVFCLGEVAELSVVAEEAGADAAACGGLGEVVRGEI